METAEKEQSFKCVESKANAKSAQEWDYKNLVKQMKEAAKEQVYNRAAAAKEQPDDCSDNRAQITKQMAAADAQLEGFENLMMKMMNKIVTLDSITLIPTITTTTSQEKSSTITNSYSSPTFWLPLEHL